MRAKCSIMIRLLLITLATLFTNNLTMIPVSAVGSEAKVLLESAVNSKDQTTFKLNSDVLKEISQLQGPIRVVAVIGNARVGKSTTLNLINHILSGRIENSVEEIFKTGDTSEPVTRDVWAHIIQPPHESGSILFLDVEGTDLGDDGVTDHLSMFTAMMSSDLNVFASDTVKNSDVTFLYRISVLSEIVFPDISLENFPKLRVVIRGDLKTPKGHNVQDLTRNAILEAKDKGRVIKNYFPRDNIAVSQIPFVKDLGELFNDFEKLRTSSYWSAITNLTDQIKNTPAKRTFSGSLFDGEALVRLAETLKETMNSNSWPDFANPYSLLEGDLCRRRKDELLERVRAMNASELETNKINIYVKFSERCRLDSETTSLEIQLTRILKEKRSREKQEEEERKRKSEDNGWLTWAWENKFSISTTMFIAKEVAYYLFLSDARLKQNVVPVQFSSQFKGIGLQEVCWKWNEIAEETFGLKGESCGVVAQEVKKIYPWAVIEGKDGYLRVQYSILHQMMMKTE